MSTTSYSRQALVRTMDEAGWSMVADRVIRGICHDMNGRINSLSSLSYLLNTGSGEWDRVGSVVGEELERAEVLSRLLRLLPDDEPGPQVLALGELLPQALHLVRLQPGFEGVEWDLLLTPDFPAVRMDETLLLRYLVLLLAGVAEETKEREEVRIEIQGRAETGTLTIRPGRLGPGPGNGPGIPGAGKRVPENMELLLAGVIQEMGGELGTIRGPKNELVLQLCLPVLER